MLYQYVTAAPSSKPRTGWGFCLGENRALAMMKKAPDKNKKEVFNDNCFTTTVALEPMHG
jgi:hypothetical protein